MPVVQPEELLAAVRSSLDFDLETGLLTWKKTAKPAGTRRQDGKIRIGLNNRDYMAHKLIWLLATGEWPTELDHRDLNPSNNRLDNLRISTRAQNSAHRRRRVDNTSGFTGVSRFKGRWAAAIWANKKRRFIGYFDSAEAAYAAYVLAAKELHGEFAAPTL